MPASREERILILKMIQEKKVTAEEGAQLLEALDDPTGGEAKPGVANAAAIETGNLPRWVRVRVTEVGSGRARLNLRLPVALVRPGLKVGTRLSPDIEKLDIDRLLQAINAGQTGEVIDVVDDEGGEHVEVFLE